MDLGEFLKFSEEICSDFLKNSSCSSIVLYGGSWGMLNFLSESMQNFFNDKGKKIEVIIDEKIDGNLIRERYFGKYGIDVDSLLKIYSKPNTLQKPA